MSISKKALAASLYLLLLVPSARACDLCSIYNSLEAKKPKEGTFLVGIGEQFSYYGRTQLDGKLVENEQEQHLASSITQLAFGYDFTDRWSIHGHVPYINRRFTRFENEAREKGTESGIGDLSLVAHYLLGKYEETDSDIYFSIFGGLKLPTGDSDRLGEESEEEHEEEEDLRTVRHGGNHHDEVPSAIHGHDLALGSGSVDFPLGGSLFARYNRSFLLADIQYTIRTEGDFNYEYADDLIWSAGPGYYLSLEDENTLSARAAFSGEHKGRDNADGETENDTGMTTLFWGPELSLNSGNIWAALGADFPIDIDNSGFQAVCDYRLRATFNLRF